MDGVGPSNFVAELPRNQQQDSDKKRDKAAIQNLDNFERAWLKDKKRLTDKDYGIAINSYLRVQESMKQGRISAEVFDSADLKRMERLLSLPVVACAQKLLPYYDQQEANLRDLAHRDPTGTVHNGLNKALVDKGLMSNLKSVNQLSEPGYERVRDLLLNLLLK